MSKAKKRSGDESKGFEGLTDAFVHRWPWPVLVLLTILVVLVLWAALGPRPASAQEDERWAQKMIWRTYCNDYGHCYRRQERVRVPAYGPRVYGYSRTWDEDERSGRSCKDVRKAVGDQHLTLDGAKKAANDSWAAAVRFHHGEKWIDLNNARRISYVCSRSSIKEQGASITTLGQALTRCELEAQPCAPLPEHERREER